MLVLVFSTFGSAQVLAKDVKVSGMGIRKCSEWQQWKDARNGEARAMALEWAHGFIAGHNVYARTGTEAASSVVADAKVLVPLLDSYCQKNPESRILSGVVAITQSLGGAKINLTPKAPPPQNPRPQDKGELGS
jgi:hypothetical protein